MFKVNNTKQGVKAFVTGIQTQALAAKIQECQEGSCSCDCDPTMMQKIKNIEVTQEDNGTSIEITGDVKAQELEPMMKACLL